MRFLGLVALTLVSACMLACSEGGDPVSGEHGGPPQRLSVESCVALIRGQKLEREHAQGPELFVEHLVDTTPPHVWEQLGVQFLHGPGRSFVVNRGQIVVCGDGDYLGQVSKPVLADLDRDEHGEIVVAFSGHTGQWNVRLWSYEPATGEVLYGPRLTVWGDDVVLQKEGEKVVAWYGKFGETASWRWDSSDLSRARRAGKVVRAAHRGVPFLQVRHDAPHEKAGEPVPFGF